MSTTTGKNSYFSHPNLLWKHAYPQHTSVENLRRMINRKHGLNLANFHDLHQYSVQNYAFWMDLWEFLKIISSVPPNPNQITIPGKLQEVPVWFPGARLNYAENLLYRKDDSIACTASGESGTITHCTYRELRQMVRNIAAALRVNGLKVGDRVAAVTTNSITSVALALATASVGGILSTTATDMGVEGILDRYRQIQPKFMFAETEVRYAGKIINLLPKIAAVVEALNSKGLQQAILFSSTATGKDLQYSMPYTTSFSAFLRTGDNRELTFEQLPFCQPLFILYSSGTSGRPKCIVHSAGGVLLQTKKDLVLGLGVGPDDTYFQYTTTGWMMWQFVLAALACGSRTVIYDGSPFHPSIQNYLAFINEQGVSVLGTSPKFLSELLGRGLKPLEIGSFEALRVIGSTGAVLTPPMFDWTQQAFGKNVHLASISGGTDICAAFVSGSPALPVYSGEIQCKSLGMKVEVWDLAGNNIEHTGNPGELVCTRPHPSIPLYFWGDPSGQKFLQSYFSMYPGVWRQGDFMVVNPTTKGVMILGRSDGVLNPSGIRFGSGEIYSILEKFNSVLEDSLCVGQRRPQDQDERVLLFLKMRIGQKLTPELEFDIKSAIRKSLSSRHVPAFVFAVEDIPYTVNGKKIEIAVKQIVSGSNVQPSGTVANPDSLQLYYKYQNIDRLQVKL